MKRILFLLLVTVLPACWEASAQMTIRQKRQARQAELKNELHKEESNAEYFSLARYKAERAAVRKERNYLEMSAGMQATLTSYNDAWIATSGGDNSIAALATFHLLHTFKKNAFEIESKANIKFGYNRMRINRDGDDEKGVWFKNQDEIALSTAPSYRFSKNWGFGSIINFRTQFANGYVARDKQESIHRKSSFMTPGYFDVSVGFTYNLPSKKWPLKVNLSPIAMSATFAENDWVRRAQYDADGNQIKPAYPYGIEDPDKTSKWEGGSSVQIDLDRTFGKNGFLRYRTTLYSFYGWITDIGQENKIGNYNKFVDAYDKWAAGDKNIKNKPRLPIHPTIRWENKVEIKATRYLSTVFSFQLYYNRAQCLKTQTQTLLSVGLSYTFKNKEKK